MKPKDTAKLLDTFRRRAERASSLKSAPYLGAERSPLGILSYTDGKCWLTLPAPSHAHGQLSTQVGRPPEPFPSQKAAPVFEGRTAPELWDAVRAVLPVCSTDEARQALQGAIIEPPRDGKPSCVCGTDGRRAHLIETPHTLPERVCFGRPDSRLWLAFQEVAGRDGQGVYLVSWQEPGPDKKTPGPQYWGAVWGAAVLTWEHYDFQAPNFRQVIPDRQHLSGPHRLSPDTLAQVREKIEATEKYSIPILNLMEAGVLQAVEYVAVARYSRETGGPAVENEIAVDCRLLLDMAAFAGGREELEFWIDRPSERSGSPDSWGPLLVENGNRKAVLMPRRVL